MRTLNVRLLGVLLLGGVVLAVLVHLLHGYQVRHNADVFLREAERAKEEGKPGERVRNLQWYVELVPNDVEVLAELGLLLADMNANGPAYGTMEKVLRLDPDRADVRRRLVSVLIALGRHRDAREHLQGYLLKDAPKDAELLYWLGVCHEAAGDYAQAVDAYGKSIQNDKSRLEVYPRLADVQLRRLKQPAEADASMKQMVESNPDSWQARVLRGRYLRTSPRAEKDRQARLDEAAQEAAKALALGPDQPDALLLAADCALDSNRFDDARRHCKRAVELAPRYVPVYTTLANLEARNGKRAEAVAWLRRGLEKNPGQMDLLWSLGVFLLDDGKADGVQAAIDQLRAGQYARPLVAYLESRLAFVQGRWLAASRGFEQIRADLTAWPDLLKQTDFWLGRCYEQLGEADLQLTAYRRAVGVDPFWAPARAGVAGALLSLGRIEEAFEEYQKLMALERAPAEGLVQLARLAVLRNLSRSRAERDWAEVEGLLKRAEAATPKESAIPILRAEMLVAQDKAPEAEALMAAALAQRPEEVELWAARAALFLRQKEFAETEAALNDADKKFGVSGPLRLARARLLIVRDGEKSKEPLRGLAEGVDALKDEERLDLWAGLAGLGLQVGDYEHARRLYQRVCLKRPHSLATRLILFDLALRAEDRAGVEENLAQIREITGEGALWLYGRAVFLALPDDKQKKPDPARLDQALDCLARARVVRPDWSRLPLLAARIHDMQGNQDLAVEEYSEAIELGERSPQAIRRVVELLYDRRRFLEADRFVRRLEEQVVPFSTQIGRVASEIALRLADFERAQQMARKAAATSKDFRDHVWLGQVLSVVGLRARAEKREEEAVRILGEAEKELRDAIQLAETNPTAWLALVQFLARTRQTENARKAIDEAAAEFAKPDAKIAKGDAALAIAQCHEAVGDVDKAEAEYRSALESAPRDAAVVRQVGGFYLRAGKANEGEALLKQIIAGEVKSPASDVAWARRSLAVLYLSRGGYDNLQDALRLVEQNLQANALSPQDQRAKVLMLASYPARDQRREAIKTMESLLAGQQTASIEERFLLAQLYLAANDWTNYRRQMQRVLAGESEDPRFVAAYIRALLGRKEVQEAQLWVPKLEKLAPDQLLTAGLKAEIAVLRGKPDEALALLQGYLEKVQAKAAAKPELKPETKPETKPDAKPDAKLETKPDAKPETKPEAKPPDNAVHFAAVALLLERLGQKLSDADRKADADRFYGEAESLYRKSIAGRVDRELLLVPFLVRQKRVTEALELTERAWQEARPDVAAEALTVLLAATQSDEAQFHRAEKVLADAIQKHQRPVPLLLVMADLTSFRGRVEEAERLYREILEKAGGNVLAMNNLTTLLAVQKKQLAEARELIDRALRLAGPRPNLLDSRAMVYLALREPQKALEDLQRALSEGDVGTLHFHRAQAHFQLGDSQAARDALKRAFALGVKAETLHPLERPMLANLQAALE